MTAELTHLLTTIVFAAHVLVGCCAHHVHAHDMVWQEMGEASITNAAESQTSCGHVHAPIAGMEISVSEEHEPCHGNDSCGEPTCSFVTSSRSLSLALQPMLNAVVLHPFDEVRFLMSAGTFGYSEPDTFAALSVPEYCALFQVWQL